MAPPSRPNWNLDIVVTTPPELFFRNLTDNEFDVFEMSLSEFLITREQAKGDRWQWCALPIFPAKAFLWLGLFVNTAAGIAELSDFRGKRLGVPDYVMTAALWMEGFSARALRYPTAGDFLVHRPRSSELSHGGMLGVDTKPPADSQLDLADRGADLQRYA